mgnify:CR=1 FL=1
MRHASLFSGIGAPELAAYWLGWENVFHCEINPFCRQVLNYWFTNSKSYEDITKTDFREWQGTIDVLTGGFPCQPFSVAGKRKGAEDDRYLWPEFKRAIREIRPPWLLVRMLLASYQWYNPARRLTWKVCRLRSMRINRSLSSKPSARTLKPKDILSNRLLYRLVPSVRPIEETESGSSLVTTASDYEKKRVKENRIRMAEYLRTNLLQTPTTVQRCEAPEKMKERALKKGYKNGTTYNSLLSQLVYGGLLPTPQAADSSIGAVIGQNDRFIITKNGMFRKVNQNGSNGSVGLGRIFHLMSTPTASDWKGGSTRKNPSLQRTSLRGEIHADYGIGKTSQLNPLFVEEMMGFPTYWILMPFLKAPGPSVKTLIPDGGQKR